VLLTFDAHEKLLGVHVVDRLGEPAGWRMSNWSCRELTSLRDQALSTDVRARHEHRVRSPQGPVGQGKSRWERGRLRCPQRSSSWRRSLSTSSSTACSWWSVLIGGKALYYENGLTTALSRPSSTVCSPSTKRSRAGLSPSTSQTSTVRDALIGPTGSVHRMAVVTRNVIDFERFSGVAGINLWS
jgi:hypothetical protein